MTLTHIAVFSVAAILYSLFLPSRWRGWALMIGSVIAIYWLQPNLVIRRLDFVLPTTTLVITVIGWLITQQPSDNEEENRKFGLLREDWLTLGVTITLVLALTGTRYLAPELRLTSRPPDIVSVIITLLFVIGITATLWRLLRNWQSLFSLSMLLVVLIFVIIKAEPLAAWLSGVLRTQAGQDASLASALDIEWLGFSYIAFRLIHTLRDRQTGKLPALTLREYLTYVVFFPAVTAGPIDRAERFITDFQGLSELVGTHAPRFVEGFSRITVGLFKKFVIADSLAVISLNATNATQATSAFDLWLLLYVYAFRLFLDFSGYSDIAIGIGILFGIKLPENFNRPYLKNNIGAFWQSWHMTLSNWVRFYVFSPLSRNLLRRKNKPSNQVIQFTCHMSTMVIIGLWHGVAWTFVIWGVWHGLGLFAHKLWTDRTRKWYISLKDKPRTKQLWTVAGVLITFHFVVLGWVWFALPDFETALSVFVRLFGAT
jgi:alginate O-acetyltransferase complex protein AlgI